MCSESIKQRIADLRDSARDYRESAARAERYEDGFQDRQYAKRADEEANRLERELQQAEGGA